jgi:rSAM/selenodomain-associated transferase 2
MLSVIVPTLNAGERLYDCLVALRSGVGSGLIEEIIVVDGGSDDDTVRIAKRGGARVERSAAGRGRQLGHGALRAVGDWFLFLHADTVLAPDWLFAVEQFVEEAGNIRRAGYFRFRLDDDNPAARRLERIVAWRSRTLGLPYGDQGLLLSRPLYADVGGFRPLPLMEDVDLVRRVGKKRLVALGVDAVTSAARYRRHGYLARSLRNLSCLGLYFLGVPPGALVRLYG